MTKKPRHETVMLDYNCSAIAIDVEIAPLIQMLWERGYETLACCQGEPDEAGTYILFTHAEDLLRLMKVVHSSDHFDRDHILGTGGRFAKVDRNMVAQEELVSYSKILYWKWELRGSSRGFLEGSVHFPKNGIAVLCQILLENPNE